MNGTFLSGATPGNIYSMPLTVGSWIVIGNAFFPNVTLYASLSISSTSNTNDTYSYISIPITGTASTSINITRCVNVTSGTVTVYLIGVSGGNVTVTSPSFYAFRIG